MKTNKYMPNDNFEKLIAKDKYQVFLFSCPALFPFSFARHPWFVINKKGALARWEIVHKKDCCQSKSWGHLHLDAFPYFKGFGIFHFYLRYFFESYSKIKLLGQIEGGEGSIAQKIIEFIENSKEAYPYKGRYVLTGPNSNTYIQWVLDAFPEWNIKLPWNFFGKNFK